MNNIIHVLGLKRVLFPTHAESIQQSDYRIVYFTLTKKPDCDSDEFLDSLKYFDFGYLLNNGFKKKTKPFSITTIINDIEQLVKESNGSNRTFNYGFVADGAEITKVKLENPKSFLFFLTSRLVEKIGHSRVNRTNEELLNYCKRNKFKEIEYSRYLWNNFYFFIE